MRKKKWPIRGESIESVDSASAEVEPSRSYEKAGKLIVA